MKKTDKEILEWAYGFLDAVSKTKDPTKTMWFMGLILKDDMVDFLGQAAFFYGDYCKKINKEMTKINDENFEKAVKN